MTLVSTAERRNAEPNATKTPRSRSLSVSRLPGDPSAPRLARIPSRNDPIHPMPESTRLTRATIPPMVSSDSCGASSVMRPSGFDVVLTKPGSARFRASPTLLSSSG